MTSEPPACVLVTSDQALIAEAIGAALESRSEVVARVPWAVEPGEPLEPGTVGLLLSDLDRPYRVRRARQILLAVPVPWLVLTTVVKGPVWGGVLDAGARLVGPSSTTLEDLLVLIGVVRAGGGTSASERRELVQSWRRLEAEQADLAERIASMTRREREVLGHLYDGTPVRTIARRLSLSEATVRSLVQKVLRKLGVRSQLAAVAALSAAVPSADIVLRSYAEASPAVDPDSPKSGKPGKASPTLGRGPVK